MESVLFGTEYNFGAFTEGRREKNLFFSRRPKDDEKKTCFFEEIEG